MRIGFFTDSYLPERHGVVSSMESFRKCLERRGHQVYIYAPSAPNYEDRNNVFRLKSFRVIKKPEMRLALPVALPAKLKTIVQHKLDIVHAHTIFTLGLVAKIISRHQKIPIIYTHHTDYTEYAKIYLKEGYVSPYLASRLTASFSNHVDAVIAPSVKVRDFLKKNKVSTPISVIPTGVDIKRFTPKKPLGKINALRAMLGIKNEEKVLIYLGRICEEKNISFIIESFGFLIRRGIKARFVIAGDGPDLERLRKIAHDFGLEKAIIFTGFINEEDKPLYYLLSDIFLFASKTDTQGLVVLEAMASGLPVVALDDRALRGMLRNGTNGYVTKEDPEEFSEKIQKLLTNKLIAEVFSNKSVEIAKSFSEEQATNKLLKLYSDLIRPPV